MKFKNESILKLFGTDSIFFLWFKDPFTRGMIIMSWIMSIMNLIFKKIELKDFLYLCIFLPIVCSIFLKVFFDKKGEKKK
jgi:hypothetical protein